MFRFLDLSISTTAVYPEVLERTKAGEKLLDLGCCFGQEIRQLVIHLIFLAISIKGMVKLTLAGLRRRTFRKPLRL